MSLNIIKVNLIVFHLHSFVGNVSLSKSNNVIVLSYMSLRKTETIFNIGPVVFDSNLSNILNHLKT